MHGAILYATLFVGKDLVPLIISLLSGGFALSFIEPASQLALSPVPSSVFFGLPFWYAGGYRFSVLRLLVLEVWLLVYGLVCDFLGSRAGNGNA